MKLRLPHKFQAALIAALASVSFTTLSTGTLAVATGAALLAGQQAQAGMASETTTNLDDHITYNGKIITMSGGGGTVSNRTYQQYMQNAEGTQMVDGAAGVYGWQYFANNQTEYGNTMRLLGLESGSKTYTSNFSPFSLGGLIVEAGAGTYTLGRSDTAIDFNGTGDVNLRIDGNIQVLANKNPGSYPGITFFKGGDWIVATGKTLEFSTTQRLSLSDGIGVNISGGGLVKVSGNLNTGSGAKIDVAENTSLQVTGTSTLGGTITNAGKVTFNGAVTLTSDLSGFEHTGTYVDYTGASGNDGFAGNMYYYIVKKAADTATSNLTSVTLASGATQTLDENGGFASTGSTDYTTYYINTNNAALDLAQAIEYARTQGGGAVLGTVDVHGTGAAITVASPQSLGTLNIAGGKSATVSGSGTLTLSTLTLGTGSTLALAGTATVNLASLGGAVNLELGAGTNFNFTSASTKRLNNGDNLVVSGAGTFHFNQTLEVDNGNLTLGSSSELKRLDIVNNHIVNIGTAGTATTHVWEKLGMGQYWSASSTLNVLADATVHITGTVASDSNAHRADGSFLLSHWGGSNTVNVSGKLISEAVISSWDGTPTITVKSGGELELRQGLTRNYSVDGGDSRDRTDKKITLTVEEGGTLTVGATPSDDNFSHAGLEVTMQSGTTLGGYFDGTHTAATVYQNITGPESGTLTFHVDGPGNTLTLQGSLSGDAALVKTGSGAFMLANGYDLNHVIDLQGGSIGFSGTYDLSGISHTPGEKQYSGGDEAGNGFVTMVTSLQLVNMEAGTTIGDTSNAHFVIDGVTATLNDKGLASTSSEPDHATFHVLNGTEKVSKGREGGYNPAYSLGAGATLVVDDNVELGKFTRETGSTGNANVQIESGKTLAVDSSASNLSISGSGTYEVNGTAALGGTLEDSWAGTVRIVDASATDLDFAQYVKGISTLELKGFSGWSKSWYQDKGVNAENIKLTNGSNGYAWEFTGTTAGVTNYVSFTGDWSGDGKLLTKSNRLDYRFSGDISRWNGMFQVGSGNLELVFSGKATAVNAAIDRNNNTLNVEVGNGTDAFSATFGNTVNASKLEIKNGATATFNKAVTLAGDLTMDGTDAAQSHAVFNEGGSVNVIDLSHGGDAHGTVTVSAGKNLTYGSSFWAANNNQLILEEGATVAKAAGAPATIKGLVGGGYVSSSTNGQLLLNNGNFTLHNVEATINTANDHHNDVQLHFDNSKLVTDQTITLKNLESVFSGMDIQNGTTTVGASGLTESATVTLGEVTLSGGNLTLAEHVIGAVNGMNVTASGTVTGGKLVMQDVITMGADATLALTGTTVDVSALPGGEAHPEYVEGQHGGSGFSSLSALVQLVDFTAGGTVNADGATFSLGSNTGTLILDDSANKGYVSFADTSYNAYYVNVAGETESLDYAINTAREKGGVTLEAVYLNAGTLNADVDTKVASLHINETADKATDNVSLTGTAANFGTVSGKGTLNVAADTTLTADTLSIAAGETLTLTGSENISFGAITNHGTLDIGTGTKVATTGDITVSAGDTFTTTGEGTLASTAELKVLGGTATLGSESEWSAIRMGNGSLNINADTTVSGMVELGPENGQMNGNLTVNNGATLTASQVKASWGYSTMAINGIVNATEKFSIATGSSNEVTGTGTINTANLDVSNVTVKATFKGGLTINVGDGGITGGQPLELQDVTIGVLEGSNGWTANRAITLGDTTTGTTFDIDANKEVTLSGAISGSGKLVKDGDGTLNLASVINNTDYTGNMEVKDGTLTVNGTSGNAFHSVSVAEGATVELIGKSNQDYRLRYTLDGGTLTSSGNATGGGNVQNDQISLTKNSTISGSANFYMLGGSYNETSLNLGGFTLTKEGTNTVNLINTDVSTGSIAVKEGTLNFVHRNDKPDSRVEADIELNGGTITGAYKYTDSETAVSRTLTAKQDVTASAAIEIGTNVTLATNVDNGKTLTMTGALTGTGNFSLTGTGTLALGNSINTTGDVTVAAGSAITFANGATISANTLGLAAGSTLDFSDYQGAIGSKVNVVTTTTGVTGYDGANIVKPAISVHGLTTEVKQEGNNIVLTFTPEAEGTMHLYILTGQSNSLGSVKGNPAPADLFAQYASGGLLYNGNMRKGGSRYVADPDWKIVDVQPRGEGDATYAVTGPEYVFEYLMLKNGWFSDTPDKDSLGVIKASLDGGGDNYWVKGETGGNYDVVLDTVKKGYEEAEAMGYANVTIDGLLYLQGESNDHGGELVRTRYTTFLANLKADLEEAGINTNKILFGEHSVLGEPATWGQTDTSVGNEKSASDTHTQLENLANSSEYIDFVYTRDLDKINPGDGMGVHYNGEAQLTIGARYAYAFAVQNGKDVRYDLGNDKKGVVRGSNDEVALTEASAWWGTAPDANTVAVWDVSSVSTPSPAVQLQGYGNYIGNGATWAVGGIHVADAYKQLVTINGGTVSLGADGITLVGGDLSITSAVHAVANQTWQAAEGHKLAVNGTTTIGDGATLTLEDGLYLTFGAITGTGNLEIGTVTFDMDLDYMLANGLGKYRTSTEEVAENGFFTGKLDLVKLTGETSAITFKHEGGVENIAKAGDLANYNLQLSDDNKALQLMGLAPDEDTYFTRKGEVTYTDTDAGEYGIYTAKQVMLSGSVDQPATLKLASALKEGVTIVASGLGGTVDIVDGVTLAATSVNAAGGPVVLAGKGTFALGGTVALPTNVMLGDQDKWTGTVRIANVSGTAAYDIKLNDLGNASSIVEFEGVTGYLNTASTTYTPNIKLTGEGLNIDAGTSKTTYTFNGDVTGNGKLNLSLSRGSDTHTYVFAGDVEGWNGELLAPTNGKTLTVKFSDKADTVNAAITRTGGTLNLYALTATTFNGAITGLSSFVVDDSKSASVLGGIGTAATTLNSGASLTIGGTANSSLGTVTLNNNTALTIAGTGAVTAGNVKVADQCASTITLGNDLAMSQLDTIGANHTLSIGSAEGVTKTLTTGKLGFDNVGTVISLQNAHMVVTGAATAGVLDAHSNNRGTMTVGENATLDLQGTTQWNTNDSKYVDLVVKDGGSVSVSGGSENKIRNVNMGENGTNASLSFGAETHTAIANTNVAASAHATVNGGNAVDFGNVNVGENAELSVMNLGDAASVSVSDVTIGAGATMGAYTGSDVSSLDEAALVIASGKTLTADNGATLNANLVMDKDSVLDVSATGGAGLLMGSTVTLNPGVTLSDGDMLAITGLDFMGQYTLFTGVDAFSYNGTTPTSTPIAFDSKTWVKASEVFSNDQFKTGEKDYYVFYSGAQNGSNVGAVYVMQLPEPTTGTLSLLALAALAARRRRK